MKITLINPNIVTQKGDFFGTGIPYMPIIPAYLASYLSANKNNVRVIDAFGENPLKKQIHNGFIIQGLKISEIISRIDKDTDIICLYAGHVVEHFIIIKLIKQIKKLFYKKPIVIVENAQAVTSYSLIKVKDDFFKNGANFIIYGDPEMTFLELINKIKSGSKSFSDIKSLIYKENGKIRINEKREEYKNLDELPFPAWDLFPIRNYWKLKYAHAPFKKSYLPLLSSRGCPYCCEFCIIPFTTKRKWSPRSAESVFEEIKHFSDSYDIKEFHFEDLNPTIDKKRIQKICRLIIKNNIKIKLKFAAGVKIETLDEDTLILLKKAGCDYISFSPESGSKNVLELMKKPFDYDYCLKMLKIMHKLKIATQACFIIGFPGETKEDIIKTESYLYKLFRNGLDETAILVMTPVPGSKPYETMQLDVNELSKFTFSPKWRKDYSYLSKKRFKMHIVSYLIKFVFRPLHFSYILLNSLIGNFKNKVEMTLFRITKAYFFIKSERES